MAEIKPVRAWRYNRELSTQIDELTSPLFDVVSEKQRSRLYKNTNNSIHLSVPLGDTPAQSAKKTLENWKASKVIELDHISGIYVYYQYFTLPGNSKEICRKGFICNIKAYDWTENVILRHENTIPSSVNDRIELLTETLLNASPTHGLYSDEDMELERYMDESMLNPIYVSEDYQGVRDVLSVVHDKEIIQKFIRKIKGQQIILADGHHRYESSLVYRKMMMEKNIANTGDEPYHFHLMYLTNSASDDLRILPTHRLINGFADFDEQTLLNKLEKYFKIIPVENPSDINEIILGKKWAFGLILKDNSYKLRLKPEIFEEMSWDFPDVVKELDLTVMHYFIIEKTLGIPGSKQRSSENIMFERNFSECLRKVNAGDVQIALITNEVTMKEVLEVCKTGYTMPQKSTYFYPKVICGYLFSSIAKDEFETAIDFSI